MSRAPFRQNQAGLTLIELLIASTLGLLLLAATGQIFLANKSSFTAQEAMGNIQENARLAMYFLQRDIRMAGYPKAGGPPAFITGTCPAIAACSTTNEDNPSGTLGTGETCATATNAPGSFDCGGGLSDQIQIQYRSTVDCLGRAVPQPVATEPAIVANRYFVSIDTATRTRRLMCRSFSLHPTTFAATAITGGQQPLVEGIESLQILYGVDTNSNPAVVPPVSPVFATRYVRADQVAAADWAKIISVRVGVLASSISTTGAAAGAADSIGQRYLVLDAPIFTRSDALRRRTFVSTVEIRNRTP